MSQEKVDLRKAEKAGRKKQNKKDKTKKLIIKIVIILVAAVIVAWIGYSIFIAVKNGSGSSAGTKEVNLDALQEYMEEVQNEVNGVEDEGTEAEE